MASRTDDELVGVLRGPAGDWEPEAIEAARVELAARGLDSAERHPYRGVVEAVAVRAVPKVALDGRTKLLALIFGAVLCPLSVLIAVATARMWKRSGDPRDGGELVKLTAIGAGIGFVLVMCVRR